MTARPARSIDPVRSTDRTGDPAPVGPHPTGPAGSHLHLWALADGTLLHAPPGQLSVCPDTGALACHLCGRWFVSLGSHLRVHGHTADTYRADLGLRTTVSLVAAPLAAQLRRRQRTAYREQERVRAQLSPGQQLARSGQLAWRRRAVEATRPEPAQRVTERAAALAAGRATQRQARAARLAALLADLGEPDLGSYLRSAYAAGASLDSLGRRTGLGSARLRRALDDAGVQLRPGGVNTAAGKRSRARDAEARAALVLGVPDLRGWLRARRAEGASLAELARAVGHTSHWVRWRLDDAA